MADKERRPNGDEILSAKEAELIKELGKTRMEVNRQLEYESFDGYEVPPPTQFSMLKKPAISIKYGKFICNMAAIRLFEGIRYVIPMANENKKRFAIVPCAEEESGSVEWARQRNKDNTWVNKDVTSIDFTENIYKLMGWNRECRYKVHGRVKNSERGLILVFELTEAIMYEPNKEDYVDPITGETKKRQVKYYPDFYKNRIGRSYNDYAAAKQMSMFESTESYVDADGLAAQIKEVEEQTAEPDPGIIDKKDTELSSTEKNSGYQAFTPTGGQVRLSGGEIKDEEHSGIQT